MKTSQDVTIDYMGYGPITIPKGTGVTHETACGHDENYHFVNDLRWIRRDYPTIAGILIHDATYYGIDIPVEYIDKT
jgi:hypothetical protein